MLSLDQERHEGEIDIRGTLYPPVQSSQCGLKNRDTKPRSRLPNNQSARVDTCTIWDRAK
jgi:hypothetical protein